MSWRGWQLRSTSVVIAMMVLVAGCGDSDAVETSGGAEESVSDVTDTYDPDGEVTDAELQAAINEFQALLQSTPTAIARDINVFGGAMVTDAEVEEVAVRLCDSQFDASVTTAWLRSEVNTMTWLLSGPAERLLRLAGDQQHCSRGPTDAEATAYSDGIAADVAPTIAQLPDRRLPDDASNVVCKVLGTPAGGTAVEEAISQLVRTASRNRLDPDEFLPLVVEVVAGSCDQWLPEVQQAVRSRAQ